MKTEQLTAAEYAEALGPAPEFFSRPEYVLLRVRRHGYRLVLPVCVLLIAAGSAGYWVGPQSELWVLLTAASVVAVGGALLGLLPLLRWLSRRATVTTRRVILREGVFVRRRTECALVRVREVRSRRTLLQRLRGSGDIELLVGAETIALHDVPGVVALTEMLQELVERNFLQGESAVHAHALARPRADGSWV